MALFTRLILALLLVVQALPGIGVVRCAEMATGFDQTLGSTSRTAFHTSAEDVETACPCCVEASAVRLAGPIGGAADVCECGMTRSAPPTTPPTEPKIERVASIVALLPSLLGLVRPASAGAPAGWDQLDGLPKRPANSTQSVLCVWLM